MNINVSHAVPSEALKHRSMIAGFRSSERAARTNAANNRVIAALLAADPHWIDLRPAIEVVPGIKPNMILKSGPPLPWEKLCPTQQNGVVNGVLHERLADSRDEAVALIERGKIEIASANDHAVVCPGAGILTPSMIVNVVEDRASGKRGYCAPFERSSHGGLCGWGTYNEEIRCFLEHLRGTIAPALARLLRAEGGIPLRPIIADSVEMGDEHHSRQDAASIILINRLLFLLLKQESKSGADVHACTAFLENTQRFFHPIGMASAMSTLQSMKHLVGGTIVTALCGNGVEYGIKISSLGDRWFTAPAPRLSGRYLVSDARPEDTLPWIGDSSGLEAMGLGGFAAAAAPAVARQLGRPFEAAVAQSRELANICLAENSNFPVPALDYRGPPAGIDMLRVLETGIAPVAHGGMIAKSGLRVGAGIARVPIACFEAAFEAFMKSQ